MRLKPFNGRNKTKKYPKYSHVQTHVVYRNKTMQFPPSLFKDSTGSSWRSWLNNCTTREDGGIHKQVHGEPDTTKELFHLIILKNFAAGTCTQYLSLSLTPYQTCKAKILSFVFTIQLLWSLLHCVRSGITLRYGKDK